MPQPAPVITFIIPVLNEARLLRHRLEQLQLYRELGHEVVVVDGGSTDDTVAQAAGLVDQIVVTETGRSLQMNRGADVASGDLFVFLHADTELPPGADAHITAAVAGPESRWGWFTVRLSNPGWAYRVIGFCMNLRTRLTFVCTGDQALFVTRELFNQVGGFPPLALMEDVAISKRLRRKSTPCWVSRPVIASSRRWEQRGVLNTILLMWWLRLLYFCGANPSWLQRLYYASSSD